MSDDKLDFLDEQEPEAAVEGPQPEVEEAAEVEAAPEPEEPTGEQPAETQEGAAPPVAEQEEHAQSIPITALLDEREKRQAADRKAEETARQLQALQVQIQRAQAAQQKPAPDWFEDPQAAAGAQMQAVQAMMQRQHLSQSRFFAERDHGKDLVDEAFAYFNEHPEQSQQLMRSPSPFHAAVDFYKQQKLVTEIGSDPDAYKARLRAEIEAEMAASAVQTAQPSAPKAPPPTMSRAPSTGRDSITPGSTFDDMFGG